MSKSNSIKHQWLNPEKISKLFSLVQEENFKNKMSK